VQNNSNYGYSINGGNFAPKDVSVEKIITSEKFDVVTLQQVSHYSGQYETYQPYLDNLVDVDGYYTDYNDEGRMVHIGHWSTRMKNWLNAKIR
jgi:hypothetical protein